MTSCQIYTQINELIALKSYAQHKKSKIDRKNAQHPYLGQHTSIFKGQGIDYLESRIYEAGDDARHIDWRLSARTGKLHTKLFVEDRQKPMFIILDQSASMYFGTSPVFKSVWAAQFCSLLLWKGLALGNMVGSGVFGQSSTQFFEPSLQQKNTLRMLKTFHTFNRNLSISNITSTDKTNQLNTMLSKTRNRLRSEGYCVVIVSDGLTFNEISLKNMQELSSKQNVQFVRVYDALEAGKLPTTKKFRLPISDGFSKKWITFNTRIQKRLCRTFEETEIYWKAMCQKYNIHYQSFCTNSSIHRD